MSEHEHSEAEIQAETETEAPVGAQLAAPAIAETEFTSDSDSDSEFESESESESESDSESESESASDSDSDSASESDSESASEAEPEPVVLRSLDTVLRDLRGTGRTVDQMLEALLFSTHAPLTKAEIGEALGMELEAVDYTLERLEQVLVERGTPLGIFTRSKEKGRGQLGYILDVKAAYRRSIPIGRPVLGGALTETLALIALNQPISQSRLVRERGSSVYEHVKELLKRGWLERRKAGRSYELRTTEAFAAEFGLPNEPDMIKRALACAAGVEGQPEVMESRRVHFDVGEEGSLDLAAEAREIHAQHQAMEPEPEAPVNRLAAALIESTPARDEDEGECVVSGGDAPAAQAGPRPALAEALDSVADVVDPNSCLLSGGEAPRVRPNPVRERVALPDGDESQTGSDTRGKRHKRAPHMEMLMSEQPPAERNETEEQQPEPKERSASFSRLNKLFEVLDDGATTDDW